MIYYDILALLSATFIALSAMFLAEIKGRIGVLRLARWQLAMAFGMTGTASALMGGWREITVYQFEMLALSSLFGIAIASTTYFITIAAIGPRLTALLFSLTSPFALILGYVALRETINLSEGLGVLLVLTGIILAIDRSKTKPDGSPKVPLWGIAAGVVTALGQALGGLFARPAMEQGVEPFTAMAIRTGLAALFFLALIVLPAARASRNSTARDYGMVAIATFFGVGMGMSLMMAALTGGSVGIVSTLSSITPIIILPMIWVRSGTPPAAMAWIGAFLAFVGAGLISLT